MGATARVAVIDIRILTVEARATAAARAETTSADLPATIRRLFDEVYAFLRADSAPVRQDGQNTVLYDAPGTDPSSPFRVECGVEVDGTFDAPAGGAVVASSLPGGAVAEALHVGPYDELSRTHEAILAWCAANGRTLAGRSWEIYGDWSDDPSQLETTVRHLLAGS